MSDEGDAIEHGKLDAPCPMVETSGVIPDLLSDLCCSDKYIIIDSLMRVNDLLKGKIYNISQIRSDYSHKELRIETVSLFRSIVPLYPANWPPTDARESPGSCGTGVSISEVSFALSAATQKEPNAFAILTLLVAQPLTDNEK
jgi:hypothetical protein